MFKQLLDKLFEADLIHPTKKEWVKSGDEQLSKIFPSLSDQEKSYLEMVTSKNYENTIAQIERATGIQVTNRNIPSLVSLLMGSLDKITKLESQHKKYLEELALTTVFKLDEFKVVEEAYQNEELKFDIKLDMPDLTNALKEPEKIEAGELTPDEEFNSILFNSFSNIDDEKLKRRFANIMISGGSISKLGLFNIVSENLEKISQELPKLYGIAASLAQLGYWITPFGVERAAAEKENSKAGSEEVIPQGDIYVIKVRAINFPYLVHELVKGIYEWISKNSEHQIAAQSDTLEDETKDIMVGPEIFKTIFSYLDTNQQELMPIIQKQLPKLEASELKDILAKNPNGLKIMKQLIADAEASTKKFRQAKAGL